MDEEYKPSLLSRLRRFMVECWRVLRITKKPSMVEFKTIVKASGLGMILLGLIGFAINMLKQLFF